MGKVKIAKKDTFIDMTAMSDVTVLLLTFFMLTSTFVKKEPVQVITPSSVSEIKVPDKEVLSILVDKTGKVFMGLDTQDNAAAVLGEMQGKFDMKMGGAQTTAFIKSQTFGCSVSQMNDFYSLDEKQRDKELAGLGIPMDSINGDHSEFQEWVLATHAVNPDIKLAIKADAGTSYAIISRVMTQLQDIRENRYYLLTSLKKVD
ncbi:MAG: biopolymer transporter ExbD [Prevotella sp.]|nr:biopolymer transporter ExbD [Candidatus Equicola faecalis]